MDVTSPTIYTTTGIIIIIIIIIIKLLISQGSRTKRSLFTVKIRSYMYTHIRFCH